MFLTEALCSVLPHIARVPHICGITFAMDFLQIAKVERHFVIVS